MRAGFVNQLNKFGSLILDQLLHRLEYFKETGLSKTPKGEKCATF